MPSDKRKHYFFLAVLISGILQASCKKEEPARNNNCALLPDSGPCKAYIEKYYFDQAAESCKVFIWGGCGGAVPFETLTECEAAACSS